MSEIKVDTLTGKTTANDITVTVGASVTQSLEQGLAKAWNCFDEGTNSSIRDSLNVASITDNGTSNFDTNLTNNMTNDDYAYTASNANPNGANAQIIAGTNVCSKTTAEYGIRSQNYAGTFSDIDGVMTTVHGDLA